MRFKKFWKWRDGVLHALGRLGRRLLFWARRKQLERELAEEIELHVRLKEVSGSRHQMGNLTLAKEESRDMWGFMWIDNLLARHRLCAARFQKKSRFCGHSPALAGTGNCWEYGHFQHHQYVANQAAPLL